MKSSVKNIMLAALAATGLCSHAYGGAKAVVGGAFGVDLLDAKTAVGQDGMLRLVFDYNPSEGGFTYDGSAVWVINPKGSVVAVGTPTIPASVGAFYYTTPFGKPQFPFERSNTAVFGQADGNTTVIFYYAYSGKSYLGVNQFGVWTYNSSGALVAAATYGPFGDVEVQNLGFDPWGKIVVKWASAVATSNTTYAGWVLDEYGTIVSATGYYGPFGNYLGKIRTNSSGQQIWAFCFPASGGTYTTSIWTFNSTGSALTNAQTYGPF